MTNCQKLHTFIVIRTVLIINPNVYITGTFEQSDSCTRAVTFNN